LLNLINGFEQTAYNKLFKRDFLQFAEFRFAQQLWQTNKKPLNEGVMATKGLWTSSV
jgi:hypothetical protein